MKHVVFPKGKQTQFLTSVKKKTNKSWEELAQILKVSRSMIFFYRNEHSKLPHKHYLILCRLASIKIDPHLQTINIKNKPEKIKISQLNEKFAEFLGALAGDGHMNKVTYEISISMDKDLDKQYAKQVLKLYKELFDIKARTYIQKDYNKIKCFAYSKELVNYLSNKYNIPIGKKKGNLRIPKQIKNNKPLLRAYIRGLFDTDGSIHRHHPKTAMLGIISRDPAFIKDVKQALVKLNFTVSLSNKNLYIYKKKEIDRFFKEIKPSNAKHNYKYKYYKKHQRVPLTKELIKR